MEVNCILYYYLNKINQLTHSLINFLRFFHLTVPKLKSILKDWIFAEDSLKTTIAAMSAPVAFRHDTAGQRRVPPSRAFDISLSVASPNPDKIKVEWVPRDAIERNHISYIQILIMSEFNV